MKIWKLNLFRLRCSVATQTGQVESSKKGETISSLNKTYFQRKQIPDNQIRKRIAHLAGIRFGRNLTSSVFYRESAQGRYCGGKIFS